MIHLARLTFSTCAALLLASAPALAGLGLGGATVTSEHQR